jgi:hypothetical protein
MALINPTEVNSILTACYVEHGGVVVQGIVHDFQLDMEELRRNHDRIAAMLNALPLSFQATGGGGASFLMAYEDREGNLWTGEHLTMEKLLVMGMALGMVKLLVPRNLWSTLPGGMPYYLVETTS